MSWCEWCKFQIITFRIIAVHFQLHRSFPHYGNPNAFHFNPQNTEQGHETLPHNTPLLHTHTHCTKRIKWLYPKWAGYQMQSNHWIALYCFTCPTLNRRVPLVDEVYYNLIQSLHVSSNSLNHFIVCNGMTFTRRTHLYHCSYHHNSLHWTDSNAQRGLLSLLLKLKDF